jgi:hypothetical protein
MQSRFWTFCAAGNIALFICSVVIVDYYHQDSRDMGISVFTRSHHQWLDGIRQWRDFYRSYPQAAGGNDTAYMQFLPTGLVAVGCPNNTDPTLVSDEPTCNCLRTAFQTGRTQCIAAATKQLDDCNFLTKPITKLYESDLVFKPFAILNSINMWGLMGSILIWLRQYLSIESEAMSTPYWMHYAVGLVMCLIQCAVLEPSTMMFVVYALGVTLYCWINFCHREDTTWWISAYQTQYLFTVPTFAVLTTVLTQKRDLAFIVIILVLAILYGLLTFCRVILEQTPATTELPMMIILFYALLLCLYTALLSLSYNDSGVYLFQSVHLVVFIYGLYLGLGMLEITHIHRIYFMELAFRVVISVSMLTELGLAHG